MQKLKNMLHHNSANAEANPTTSGSIAPTSNTYVAPGTTTGTSSYGTLDKNRDGRVDAADFSGRGTSTTQHNPLDRNHDGKIGLGDLKPSSRREASINDQNLSSLDRNRDGRVDSLDFQQRQQPILGGSGMTTQTTTTSTLNPLDRNMDGRVDSLDFQQQQQQPMLGQGSIASVREAPTRVEVIEKNMVVHEHIHPVQKEEIQPIIHREREQLDIHQVTRQLHETTIQPTLVQQRELAAEVRAPIIERSAPIQENIVLPSVDRDATVRSVQMNAPILEETIRKTVIEEVQPVLERDVYVPTIVQERQDIYEKIVEAPHVYRETLPVRELGAQRTTEYVQQQPVFVEQRYQQPIVQQPIIQQPIIQQQRMVEPMSMSTTTTTTDTFVPAKLVKEGELKGNVGAAPIQRRVI